MKILRDGEILKIHLGKREKHFLVELLSRFPCLPSTHRLSKTSKIPEASQRLLDEALSEQRNEKKRQVQGFLQDSRRFEPIESGYRLSLSKTEAEWLLQVLNDIRVGSWVLMGAPEENLRAESLNKESARHFWSMELAGYFQMEVLSALGMG